MKTSRLYWLSLAAPAILSLPLACGSKADEVPPGGDGVGGSVSGGTSGTGSGPSSGTGGVTLVEGTGGDPAVDCTDPTAECVFQVEDPTLVCGNGLLEPEIDETCDDGNTYPGDGCSGVCELEPNAVCEEPGEPCYFTVGCGNGEREPGEACDDGNELDNNATTGLPDGCSADCTTVAAGFYCPNPGEACVPAAGCGDGRLQVGETCDDGGTCSNSSTACTDDDECAGGTCEPQAGDGCSDLCRVETGFRCTRVGQPCEALPECGNGVIESGEGCDDDNTAPNDGCSYFCQPESADWDCSTEGVPCTPLFECGNSELEAREQCDDGNTANGDGCKSNCTLQSGYRCSVPGRKCVPVCGDGVWIRGDGLEECDDSNSDGGDGCSAKCQVEPGWVCSATTGADCHQTDCGDGTLEGDEVCDEGTLNGVFYGDGTGCSKTCTQEPRCRVGSTTGPCTSTCGDGIKLGAELCDDGNLANGDGCSSSCTVETAEGFTCTTSVVDDTYACGAARCLDLPLIVRDFKSYKFAGGHPDFFFVGADRTTAARTITPGFTYPGSEAVLNSDATPGIPNSICPNLVQGTLDADGKPTWRSHTCNGLTTVITNQDSFSQWYRDTGLNTTYLRTLTLTQAGAAYQFSDSTFFPIDGVGDTYACTDSPYNGWGCKGQNYWFTSEVRYLFRHNSAETRTFAFNGDDDVWVFVNGQLALDLGGTHQATAGTVTITGNPYGMTNGNLYEIVMFHAERHPVDSSYTLTLTNFDYDQSSCDYSCGDGKETVFEECDLGTALNTGAYNGCTSTCTFGPFCGDGTRNGPEECDDGRNITVAYNGAGCGPGCTLPPRCGDGYVDVVEQCDLGDAQNTGAYGGCSDNCQLGPFCGDGKVQATEGEQCDDGVNDGGTNDYGICQTGCTLGPRCGDGEVQAAFGELCDEGDQNGVAGSGCDADCGLPAVCGDGIVQSGEECDDGVNDGSYGGCAYDCKYGPRCGDGVKQEDQGEECDLGNANRDGLYGGCSTACKIGPHCGDGDVQEGTREECDDGNNDSGDGCSSYCITELYLPQ